MKKMLCALMLCAVMLGVVGCGEKEEVKNAGVATLEQNGVVMTMRMDAKGDAITRITQESVIDLTGYTEEQIEAINATVESAEDLFTGVENVEYTCEEKDGALVETIVIPTDEETLAAVIEQGILPVDNEDSKVLSLEATLDNLESSGWTVE